MGQCGQGETGENDGRCVPFRAKHGQCHRIGQCEQQTGKQKRYQRDRFVDLKEGAAIARRLTLDPREHGQKDRTDRTQELIHGAPE